MVKFPSILELNLRTFPFFGIKPPTIHMRRIRCILFAAVFLLAGSRAAESADAPPSSTTQTVARIHWLGTKQISVKTNTAPLVAIWNLPESRRLERQTLDKLSLTPW